jgi:hypothetical protein
MSKAEDMRERAPELGPLFNRNRVKRCHHCNVRFGLIRYHHALKHFCSKRCVAKYEAALERYHSRSKRWMDFLAPKQ